MGELLRFTSHVQNDTDWMAVCRDPRFGCQDGTGTRDTVSFLPFKVEEGHLCALRRRELEVHSLALQNSLQEQTWSDERYLMQRELCSLKQNIFLFYVKLRWLLKHWRQGKQAEEDAEDFTEVPLPGEFLSFASVLLLLPPPARPCCPPSPDTYSHVLLFQSILSSPIQAVETQWVVRAAL